LTTAQSPRVAAILGPTASGKTALACAIAAAGCPLEVVGCDALQLFKGLDAATAKPTAAERSAVPHHLVDAVAATERIDAVAYAERADAVIAGIASRGKWPVLVGGTGLYLRAVVHGLAEIPPIDPELRRQLGQRFDKLGSAALHAELAALDPTYAAATPAANRQRVLRALEVALGTGTSFTEHHRRGAAKPARYQSLQVVLEPPRALHKDRIAARARAMVLPLFAECRTLLQVGVTEDHHATQAIGYRDAIRMLRTDTVDRQALGDQLVRAHVRYAKRQRTWFNKLDADLRIEAADPTQPEVVAALVDELRAFFSVG
jgi:tRNA dimethylallyltransferase